MVISECKNVSIVIVPGWKVGYLVSDYAETSEYRVLPVVAIAETADGLEPVVMAPDGKIARASELGETAFSVGPDECVERIAQAHAARRGHVNKIRLAA